MADSMTKPNGGPGAPGLLARPALAVQVADALRELILEGEIRAGEKIREKELTERFGVSRTPLREAMKILAAEGLIDLIPNRGAVISRRSPEELADAFPILAALEAIAGAQAAERATEAELEEIARLTSDLRACLERRDRPRYFEINQAIHTAILAASRNDILARTHANVAGLLHRARYQANLTPSRWQQALCEHERIAEALTARRAEEVGRLLKDHILAKFDAIIRADRESGG